MFLRILPVDNSVEKFPIWRAFTTRGSAFRMARVIDLCETSTMYETATEIEALDELIMRSRSGGSAHLQAIISGDHALGAAELLPHLEGMKVVSLATVTKRGEPRISAVDGHFIHGAWTFGTDGASIKARHLHARPSVSLSFVDGEKLGVFVHGAAQRLLDEDPRTGEIIAHWTAHYGSDPRTWGDDIRMFRLEPSWMVAYRGAE